MCGRKWRITWPRLLKIVYTVLSLDPGMWCPVGWVRYLIRQWSEKFFTLTILLRDSDNGLSYALLLVDDVSSFVPLQLVTS